MHKRVLVKISGESLSDKNGGICPDKLKKTANDLISIKSAGIELAVVIGAGNFWRGTEKTNLMISRTSADQIGILATIMNAIALSEQIKTLGSKAECYSALEYNRVTKYFNANSAISDLEQKKIVLVSGGTGNPYFSTDSAAALRALELNCKLIIKATKVDGLYDKDPKKHNDAKKYEMISYQEVLNQQLKVMDLTAICLLQENNIPLRIVNMKNVENIIKAINDENIGTKVY